MYVLRFKCFLRFSEIRMLFILESLYKRDVFLQQLPNLALAIFLLVERFRSDKPSFWLPYIEALPESYTTCMYFSIDDLNELRGSPAFGKYFCFYSF